MVVTAQRLASEVGAEVLRAGGNAVDAAVAVGYALAVVHPCCGNIGGGGFATLRMADGKETFFNFREKAPAAATRDMYLDGVGELVPDLSTVGYKAVGVPGTVMGLEAMREAYGTMSREALIAPAIRLARDGFVLTEGDAAILAASAEDLAGAGERDGDLLQGRRAAQGGRPAGAGRPRGDAAGDLRRRRGRLLRGRRSRRPSSRRARRMAAS